MEAVRHRPARPASGVELVPGFHAAAERPVSPTLLTGVVNRLRELFAGIQVFDRVI